MTADEYKAKYSLDPTTPVPSEGDRILFNGAPYDLEVFADSDPVPQKAAGSSPQIGVGNVQDALFTDMDGNGIAIAEGSQCVQILDGRRVKIQSPTGVWVIPTWGVQNGGLVYNDPFAE